MNRCNNCRDGHSTQQRACRRHVRPQESAALIVTCQPSYLEETAAGAFHITVIAGWRVSDSADILLCPHRIPSSYALTAQHNLHAPSCNLTTCHCATSTTLVRSSNPGFHHCLSPWALEISRINSFGPTLCGYPLNEIPREQHNIKPWPTGQNR